jgi:hypothetical protein
MDPMDSLQAGRTGGDLPLSPAHHKKWGCHFLHLKRVKIVQRYGKFVIRFRISIKVNKE